MSQGGQNLGQLFEGLRQKFSTSSILKGAVTSPLKCKLATDLYYKNIFTIVSDDRK
jgi:hypothetical protein